MSKLESIFSQMAAHYVKGKVDREIVYYFTLGDAADEKWTVFCRKDGCEVKQGKAKEQADCVLKTSADLFQKIILQGYTPGALDFMRGKIKTNDVELLKKLKEVFPS